MPVAFTLAGDTVVSTEDVEDRVRVLQVLYGLEVPDAAAELAEFRRNAAQTFAATLLIGEDAADRGVAVDDAAATDALGRYVEEEFGADRGEFEAALEDNGIGVDDVLSEVRLQLDGQALFDLVSRDVVVTGPEIRAAYDTDPAAWTVPARRRLSALVTADEDTARRAVSRVAATGDFAAVARRFSLDETTREQGGLLGTLSRDQLDPAFGAAAFRASVGDVFGPVRTSRGWYVGQVTQAFPPMTTFPHVRATVEDALVAQRSITEWSEYVSALLDRADVEYEPAYRPRPDEGLGVVPPGGGP